MSEKYEQLRKLAVDIAKVEVKKKVKETTAENRSPIIDKYIQRAGGKADKDDPTKKGSEWCGMFVYYCYSEAANRLGMTLPFRAGNLWSGRKVKKWGLAHPDTVVYSSPILPGDIYVTMSGHIGMATSHAEDPTIFQSIDGNQANPGSNRYSLKEKTQKFSNIAMFVRI